MVQHTKGIVSTSIGTIVGQPQLLASRISDRYLELFGIKKIVMVAGLYDTVLLDGNGYHQEYIGSGGGAVQHSLVQELGDVGLELGKEKNDFIKKCSIYLQLALAGQNSYCWKFS